MRVAVFCGSSHGPAAHTEAAAAFARELVQAGAAIVYGGGRTGLMGTVADAAMRAGGEVIGVLPEHMFADEVPHHGLTRLEVVATMHERKARMADLADAFVALPGGAGTLEELFEAWTWGNIGLHAKPVALLNVAGFWDPLIEQVRLMAEAGYLKRPHATALGIVSTSGEFLRFVAAYDPPPARREGPQAAAAKLAEFSQPEQLAEPTQPANPAEPAT